MTTRILLIAAVVLALGLVGWAAVIAYPWSAVAAVALLARAARKHRELWLYGTSRFAGADDLTPYMTGE